MLCGNFQRGEYGRKKIAIIGIGAIGSILTAFMVKAGYAPCLIDASIAKRSSLGGKEFNLHDPTRLISGDFTVVFPAIHGSVSALIDLQIDYLFICVKTPFLDSLLQNLENVIAPHTVIISFQNGLGTEDRIAERFGRNKTIRAVINFAGSLNGHNQAILSSGKILAYNTSMLWQYKATCIYREPYDPHRFHSIRN